MFDLRSRSLVLLLGATAVVSACGDFKQAVKQEMDKQRGDDLVVEGANAYQAGNYSEAIDKLEQALELGLKYKEPDVVETMIGNCFLQLDEFERAVEHHQKALELNPKNHEAMVNLGATYRQMDRLDDAERMYVQAAELAPDYPELHASLGALYLFRGKPDEAEKSLRRAIELSPSLAVAHANLSLVLANLGRFDEADAELRRAVELGYKNGAVLRPQLDALREDAAAGDGAGDGAL